MNLKRMLLLLALSAAISAVAGPQKVKTSVEKVTLFIDGAQVTRTRQVDLPAGNSTVVFTGLSPYLDDKSMQVSAKGPFTVTAVNRLFNHTDSLERSTRQKTLEQTLEETQRQLDRLKASREVVDAESELLKTNCSVANRNVATPLAAIRELNEYYAARLEALHATVKYYPDAFKNARRAARVEVALVSVDIPDREPVSRIRLDLKNETAERLKENPEFAALVSSDPITAAIERYNAAAEGVRRIYEEYNGIKSLFSSAGAGKKENPVMAFTKSYNDAIRELRGMYWKQLFEMPQLFDAMTYEMQQDYQKRIKELEGYDFSAYNILTVREEISRNLLSSIDHEIIKLFDDWTNLHYNDEYSKNVHYYNGWCTNSAYKINRKVIFRCNAFDTYDGRFCPRYNATGHVAQIERVLHFLDTNGKPYNGDELRAVLDAAEKSGQTQKIQLHYFTATFYKKGTCHIEFTNTDVLKSFNLYAGQRKGWLPPTYGKKSYHDMAAADRRVVDSYEGEASYTDTLTRHLIPTQSTFLQLNA